MQINGLRHWEYTQATRNTTKYAPYLRWRHGKKSICLVEMNISALRLIIGSFRFDYEYEIEYEYDFRFSNQ